MSVHYDRTASAYRRALARGRRGSGRRRFAHRGRRPRRSTRPSLGAADAASDRGRAQREPAGDGVYAVRDDGRPRWRFVFRQSDGTLSTRRGFTSRAARRGRAAPAVESIERGEVKVAREHVRRVLGGAARGASGRTSPPGSLPDFETHGRKRLLPWFGDDAAGADRRGPRPRAGSPTWPSSSTTASSRRRRSTTPAPASRWRSTRRVAPRAHPPQPVRCGARAAVERREIDYLRLDEIEPYLDACADHYRPLAEFLIGTGARISEALALRFGPTSTSTPGSSASTRQRGRDAGDGTSRPRASASAPCRSARDWSQTLRACTDDGHARRPDDGWLFLCPPPAPRPLRARTEPRAAEPQDRARLARGGARRRRPARHAAALAPAHRRRGLARDRATR